VVGRVLFRSAVFFFFTPKGACKALDLVFNYELNLK